MKREFFYFQRFVVVIFLTAFWLTSYKTVLSLTCDSCSNIVDNVWCEGTGQVTCNDAPPANPPWTRGETKCCRGTLTTCVYDPNLERCLRYSPNPSQCVECYTTTTFTECNSNCFAADCCSGGQIIAGHCDGYPGGTCWFGGKYKTCCKNDGSGQEAACNKTGDCPSQYGQDLCPVGYSETSPGVTSCTGGPTATSVPGVTPTSIPPAHPGGCSVSVNSPVVVGGNINITIGENPYCSTNDLCYYRGMTATVNGRSCEASTYGAGSTSHTCSISTVGWSPGVYSVSSDYGGHLDNCPWGCCCDTTSTCSTNVTVVAPTATPLPSCNVTSISCNSATSTSISYGISYNNNNYGYWNFMEVYFAGSYSYSGWSTSINKTGLQPNTSYSISVGCAHYDPSTGGYISTGFSSKTCSTLPTCGQDCQAFVGCGDGLMCVDVGQPSRKCAAVCPGPPEYYDYSVPCNCEPYCTTNLCVGCTRYQCSMGTTCQSPFTEVSNPGCSCGAGHKYCYLNNSSVCCTPTPIPPTVAPTSGPPSVLCPIGNEVCEEENCWSYHCLAGTSCPAGTVPDSGYVCQDSNQSCCLENDCDPSCIPTPIPTGVTPSVVSPTPIPTSTTPPSGLLCCIGGICRAEFTECTVFCEVGAALGSSCVDTGGGVCGMEGYCTNMTPSSFTVPAGGDPVSLTMSGLPNPCCGGPLGFSYKWYSSPIGGISEFVVGNENPNPDTEKYGLAQTDWQWTIFQSFQVPKRGYLDRVRVDVGFKDFREAYMHVMVTDSSGNRLTDNTAPSGGLRHWVKTSAGDWLDYYFETRPLLEPGNEYRIYVNPQPGSAFAPYGFWVGTKNALKTKFYHVWLTPSDLPQATFATSGDDTFFGHADVSLPAEVPVGTSYRIVGEVSCSLSVQHSDSSGYGSGQCLGTATATLPPSEAWFQTQDINVYANGNLDSKVPGGALPAYFDKDGTGGFPGTIVYRGSETPNFVTTNRISSKSWLSNTSSKNIIMNYQYLLNRLKVDLSDSQVDDTSTISQPVSSGTYLYNSPQTIQDNDWQIPDGLRAVIFVNGDLTIKKDITVAQGGFLAIISSGNISFSAAVTQAQGFFLADEAIIVQPADAQFKGQGSFVGWLGVQLWRDLGDSLNRTTPAELFSSRPDLWINAPEEFKFSVISREEMMP